MPRDLSIVYATAFVRAVCVGTLSIFFGLHLGRLGMDKPQIGMVIAAGLAGMAVSTLIAGILADRLGRRGTLLVLGLLMAIGGALLTVSSTFLPILALSFIGMVNGMGRDRGAAQAIDQAILAQTTVPETRTLTFATYTLVVDIGTALGALIFIIPSVANDSQLTLSIYAGLLGGTAIAYLAMSRAVEVTRQAPKVLLSPQSRKLVLGFAALSGIDSLGGGFVTRALLTYWFVERFHVSASWVGPLFAAASAVNAVAYLAAAWLSRRIGLINTMVFTHVPSSIFLMLVPLAPNFPAAVALFLVREFLAPMDVPTRQSYLAAIVAENERTAAAGLVNVARNGSWVVGPTIAGWAMTISLSAPLYLAGSIKIVYDIGMWFAFRRIKPPEEK